MPKPPKAPKGAKTEVTDLTKLLKVAQTATRPKELEFGIIATGPRTGQLLLIKRGKLKRKDAEEFAKESAEWEFEEEKKKNPRAKLDKQIPDVAVGRCKPKTVGGSTLLLTSRGKFPQKCKSCIEYLVTMKHKAAQFSSVEFEEGDEGEVSGDDTYQSTLRQLRKELAMAEGSGKLPDERILELTKLLDQAEKFVSTSDFDQADEALDRVEDALDALSPGVTQTGSEQGNVIRVRLETLRTELQAFETLRTSTVKSITQLAQTLTATNDARAVKVAKIIKVVADEFPTVPGGQFGLLDKAVESEDQEQLKVLRISIESAAKEVLVFMKEQTNQIVASETNPFAININVQKPLNNALTALAKAAAAVTRI